MSFFSRLTDIVTCSLTELLAEQPDPRVAIEQIIHEMSEGLAGAKRSVATAAASEERLQKELEEHRGRIEHWTSRAKQELSAGDEQQARLSLVRRHEVADLVAGLEQQHSAAVATCEHLTTMLRALEARLADAQRRRLELQSPAAAAATAAAAGHHAAPAPPGDDARARQIDAELEALKRELGRDG